VMNASALNYQIPSFPEFIPATIILHEDPADAPTCQLNCKGIGEGTNVPVAPAIANAFYNATGVRLRNHPWTPDKVLAVLGKA
jgi:nicotinate dehydrogenase subunit B